MKKIITAITAAILTTAATVGTASAQLDQFANQGATAADLFSGDAQTTTAEGDMNKDGVKDLVIGIPEGIAIYWGKNGGYTLYNTYAAPQDERDGITLSRSFSITSKGVLRIECNLKGNYDEHFLNYTYVYMFRFQDGDFYLIGGKVHANVDDQTCIAYSVNTLTHQVAMQDCDGNLISEMFEMPEEPLKSISEIELGNPTFLDAYITTFNEGKSQMHHTLFVCDILDQIAKRGNNSNEPALTSTAMQTFAAQNISHFGSVCKDMHQRFWFRWQHDPYDEDLEAQLDCFPLNDGSYFVMFAVIETGDYEHYLYDYYVYKDKTLTPTDKYMPTPGINDYYSNADKFPKKVVDALKEEIQFYSYTYVQENDKLIVTFNPWACDETGCSLPEDLQCFESEDSYCQFPTIEYTWKNGQFVRDPESKPREEDLSYFK